MERLDEDASFDRGPSTNWRDAGNFGESQRDKTCDAPCDGVMDARSMICFSYRSRESGGRLVY